jgi:hypothetical protein
MPCRQHRGEIPRRAPPPAARLTCCGPGAGQVRRRYPATITAASSGGLVGCRRWQRSCLPGLGCWLTRRWVDLNRCPGSCGNCSLLLARSLRPKTWCRRPSCGRRCAGSGSAPTTTLRGGCGGWRSTRRAATCAAACGRWCGSGPWPRCRRWCLPGQPAPVSPLGSPVRAVHRRRDQLQPWWSLALLRLVRRGPPGDGEPEPGNRCWHPGRLDRGRTTRRVRQLAADPPGLPPLRRALPVGFQDRRVSPQLLDRRRAADVEALGVVDPELWQ